MTTVATVRRKLWGILGWPGALAAALTLSGLAGEAALERDQTRLDAQRAALSERRLALKRQTARAQAALPSSPVELATSLPPDSDRQSRTSALLALTTERGLPWPRTEFRYQSDQELGMAQYRVAMNLSGSYSALRGLVAEALRRDPALALESVRFKRENPTSPQLNAEIAFVLHMKLSGMPIGGAR